VEQTTAAALCLGCASLVLASGCAFPILNAESQRPPAALAFARSKPVQPAAARPEQVSRPHRGRGRSARSSHASVLGPSGDDHPYVPGPPPEPEPSDCYEALRQADIHFETIDADAAKGVALPLRLTGPVGGVEFVSSDHNPTHAILDCRLALALRDWAMDLRKAGVRRVEHYSMYRPGAHVASDGRVSGHAHGLAIDAARFTLNDGEVLDVLSDWEGRERGASPCPMRPDEAGGSRLLRGLTCEAVDEKLFQVIITPHHDKAHQNHVHLERKPEVDWTYVR
jgi:hypothetical protein